jgi:Fur family transcriptional regulator, zinc uptake regulator
MGISSAESRQATIERIIQRMESQKLRITGQRRLIAERFASASGFVTPREVYDYMNVHHPGLSYDTVYRNLRTLVELHILEQFDHADGVKFRLHCNTEHTHHHHFICTRCDALFPLRFCPMEINSLVPDSFSVTGHRFEVYGLCNSCK